MNDQKLKFATIGTIIGAFVVIVAMVLVWKFRFYDPVVTGVRTANEAYDTAKISADKLAPAQKAALLAQQRLGYANGELQYFRTRYRSLPLDLAAVPGDGPRYASWTRYLNEYSQEFGLRAREQLIRAADESGVVIGSNIKVDAPPQNPEEIVAPPSGFLKPEAAPLAVEITGTFDSIVRFFQIINRSEILMVVGNVKLEGTSPEIKATFTLTQYLLVSGPSATVAPIAGASGAAAAPGAEGATNPEGGPGAEGQPASAAGAP